MLAALLIALIGTCPYKTFSSEYNPTPGLWRKSLLPLVLFVAMVDSR